MPGTRAQTQLLPCLPHISIEAKQQACCWNFILSRQLETLRNGIGLWGHLEQRPQESNPPSLACPRSYLGGEPEAGTCLLSTGLKCK